MARNQQGRKFFGTRHRRWSGGILSIVLLGGVFIYQNVHCEGTPIYTEIAQVPPESVAIVFGAQGHILEDRVATGAALYHAGKVQTLLLTGDNSRNGYNEPETMKKMALADGVPASALVCDYAGFRTFDSVYRARAIFGIHRAILVTQAYHLPRAMFLARHLGIEVVGVDAALRRYPGQPYYNIREFCAVEGAWMDIYVWHKRPRNF